MQSVSEAGIVEPRQDVVGPPRTVAGREHKFRVTTMTDSQSAGGKNLQPRAKSHVRLAPEEKTVPHVPRSKKGTTPEGFGETRTEKQLGWAECALGRGDLHMQC